MAQYQKKTTEKAAESPDINGDVSVPVSELAAAFQQALGALTQQQKDEKKKTLFTRKKNTPWTPKDGSPKLSLKRKLYQHSLPISEKMLTNEQVELANKIRPGVYCDGFIKVVRRRDKGIDIDYPVKTAAQRLRLMSQYRISTFTDLLRLVVEEGLKPRKPVVDED